MDIHKAAAWSQLIYLPAGLYCAYGTFANLHPGFQMPGVNPTIVDVSLGALLVGVFLVVADGLNRWLTKRAPEPTARQGKPAWQSLQWANAERERLEKEANEWKEKWEQERGGSSARDETIKQLAQERDSAVSERDTAYCAEVDRHNATKKECERRVASLQCDLDKATNGSIDIGKRLSDAGSVLSLKRIPWEIKRRWPDSDFLLRPANKSVWLPRAGARNDPPWLATALEWHRFLATIKPCDDSEHLVSMPFDDLMDYLDQIAAIRGGWGSRTLSVPDSAPEVRIINWGPKDPTDLRRKGLFIKVSRSPASQIQIHPFQIGSYLFSFSVVSHTLTEDHGQHFLEPMITKIGSDGCYINVDAIEELKQHGYRTSNGTILNLPIRTVYTGPSIIGIYEGLHEMDAVGGFIRYFGRQFVGTTT